MTRIIPSGNRLIPHKDFDVFYESGIRTRSITSSFYDNTTVKDALINISSDSTTENYLTIKTEPQNLKVNISADYPGKVIVDNNIIVPHPNYHNQDNLVNIYVEKYGYKKSYEINIRSQSEDVVTFINYVSGSLGEHIKSQTSQLSGSDQNIYGSYGIRNMNVWTENIDLTGIAFWNSRANNVHRGGVLISPRHILMVKHSNYHLQPGDTVRYITNDNTVVERTVQAISDFSSHDKVIGLLNSDVPNTIKFYKIIPSNWEDYLSIFDNSEVPTIHVNKSRKIFQRYRVQKYSDYYSLVHKTADINSGEIITGDSGQPFFHIINGELVLLSVNTSSNTSPGVSDVISDINSRMTSLGGGYTLTTVDLSEFNNYGP